MGLATNRRMAMAPNGNRPRIGPRRSDGDQADRPGERSVTSSDVVYLVRHGRTPLNAAGLLRGRLDPPLDDTGAQEAAALGRVFQGVTAASVFSSPLVRARQTAAAIAD